MTLKARCLTLLLSAALGSLSLFGASKPERVAYFGPNGTHWPEKIPTPFMYDNTVANIVEVNCTWDAIRSAIQNVTNDQANRGTLILVRPGTLVGKGSSSGSDPVLESIGSVEWGQRVTVAPRDGYGSVKWTKGVRFLKVFGVCFAGFESLGSTAVDVSGVKMQGCRRSALAWIKCTGHFGVYGTQGFVTEGIELAEVVQPNHYVVSDDSTNFYAGGGGFTDWRLDGCYHAPRFYEDRNYAGDDPHTDTIQFAAAGGGNYSNITIRDTAIFASNNTALQTGNVNGLNLEKVYIVAGASSLWRYPFLDGGKKAGATFALNGSGKNFVAKDCVFIGEPKLNSRDTSRIWNSVQNCWTHKEYESALNTPLIGSWTVKPGLNHTNSGMPEMPSDLYLERIWANPGVTTKVSRPVMIPPAGTYNEAQTVTLTCSTANASIFYTTNGSEPTPSSTRYSGPISVPANVTIKAMATAPTSSGLDPSPVQTAEYRIINQVKNLVITPPGGLFSTAQTVTISTPTAGAAIYYTLDGQTPTTASARYTGPIVVSSTSMLQAIGVKAGAESSEVATASFAIGDVYEGSEAWTNIAIPTQTGQFTISWTSAAMLPNIDGVTGVGPGVADGYEDLACLVRFYTNGRIEARNRDGYTAVNVFPYTRDVHYRFTMTVNFATKRYSVTVAAPGGNPVTIAENYEFRDSQASATSVNTLALVTLKGESHTVSDVTLGTTPAPAAPTGLRVTNP